jgi:serine/threonine-protein kinase
MSLHKKSDETLPSFQPSLHDSTQDQVFEEEATTAPPVNLEASLTPKLRGKDGAILRLVPSGKIILPEYFELMAGKSVSVDAFYMDETQVTNHQYVEFLNHYDISRLTVKEGVVRNEDGKIWFLLGEVLEGYEPIIFRNGKFLLNDPAHAGSPVLRVTAYGAAAYANFYGRRLPTDVEWLYAASASGRAREEISEGAYKSRRWMDMGPMMDRWMGGMSSENPVPSSTSGKLPRKSSPVILYEPDAHGIRGLNADVGEWGLRGLKASSTGKKSETKYVVMGAHWSNSKEGYTPAVVLARQPWEAFEEVGFRCALSVQNRGK